jgi:RES domain-containing protein
VNIWRISNHRDLAGAGGLRAGGRWHSPGRPIVYCAEHPASALLEILAHLDVANLAALPDGYQLLEIQVPDALDIESLPTHALTLKWQSDEASTQAIGDKWLADRSSALLRVPSALVPKVWNYLVNPLHPGAAQLVISAAVRYPFDSRLFKLVAGEGRRRPAASVRRR